MQEAIPLACPASQPRLSYFVSAALVPSPIFCASKHRFIPRDQFRGHLVPRLFPQETSNLPFSLLPPPFIHPSTSRVPIRGKNATPTPTIPSQCHLWLSLLLVCSDWRDKTRNILCQPRESLSVMTCPIQNALAMP